MVCLYSPLVGTSTIGFNPVQHSAIQIHNNERLHWLTSAAGITSTGTGEVDILDSLSSRSLSTPLCRQLADIYRVLADEDGVIKVNIKPVQQQRLQEGNCGPFAIAFAASLCHRIDPSIVTFTERSLRPHIHHAFESEKIDPFPQTSKCGRRATATQINISIYCICHSQQPKEEMIQCDGCDNWYHFVCIRAGKDKAKMKKQQAWFCKDCYKRVTAP